MAGWWVAVVNFGLTLWVIRGPLAAVVIGAVILLVVPQAQDLLVEPAMDGLCPVLLLLAGIIFVWAMPTHYAARLLVETDARYLAAVDPKKADRESCLQTWSPRVLGAAIFAIFVGASLRSRANVPDLSPQEQANKISEAVKSNLLWLAGGFAVLFVAFFVYAAVRRRIAAWRPIVLIETSADRLWRAIPSRLRSFLSLNPQVRSSRMGPLILFLLFLLFAAAPIIWPYEFAKLFPRAAAVPFALGGWVPLLALLSGLGRRYRVPFITIGIVALVALPLVFHTFYRVPAINAQQQAATVMGKPSAGTAVDPSGLTLNDAIRLWKAANKCTDTCPRPIILAAAGGASRAGFYTASIVGQLLDGNLLAEPGRYRLSGQELQNRLFAFSTVSGGSVGAVMAVAAMEASRDGTQPCRDRDRTGLWYPRDETIKDWRSCLEALLAGDFLTPIFTGLIFHDVFRFVGWPDRGALLEQSFEDRFRRLIKRDDNTRAATVPHAPCTGDLACPFTALRPMRDRWLPLLVLNSTSVDTGQRIITTALEGHFEPTARPCPIEPRLQDPKSCRLFEGTQILRDMLGPADAQSPNDVRLSTAAHNSARFPLLSPPGEIRDGTGRFIDRIVDGGYFENLGVQTATELAEAIAAVDKNLNPFVLVISNDPQLRYLGPNANSGDAPDASAVGTDIVAPIMALANTRNARGVLALEDLPAILDAYNSVCNFAYLRVWGERAVGDPKKARDVAWSWWLSRPVQQYLHEQTSRAARKDFERENARPIRDLLGALDRNPAPADQTLVRCEDRES